MLFQYISKTRNSISNDLSFQLCDKYVEDKGYVVEQEILRHEDIKMSRCNSEILHCILSSKGNQTCLQYCCIFSERSLNCFELKV